MANPGSNPLVTINMISRDQAVGFEDYRALIVSQKTSAGSATDGALGTDMPRTPAEINALWGANSTGAMVAREFRRINKYTNVDYIALDDAGSNTKATATIVFAGTATENATLTFSIASMRNHKYAVDVETGDDEAAILTKLEAAIALDTAKPFTYADDSTDTATLTAANGGKIANEWPLVVQGAVAGITVTLTGWASGATDPTLTNLFDVCGDRRYQTILFPNAYATDELEDFVNERFNVDNDVLDGVAHLCSNDSFSNVKTKAAALNSPSIVIHYNEPTDNATWKGAHVAEAPDVIACTFAAAEARRFEPDVSISDIVVNNAAGDQFGGVHTSTLPYFNTPYLGYEQPYPGTGLLEAEIRELEAAGVSVYHTNRTRNAIIAGHVVTTYLNDAAGNPDDTWGPLNWRRTHANIREYLVRNLQAEYDQARLTTGSIPAGNNSFANEATIRAFVYLLYDELADLALTIKGIDARQYFEDKLSVILDLALRKVTIDADTPMVSQLGKILGAVKFSFNPRG